MVRAFTVFFIFILFSFAVKGQEIFRFEHINTQDGLSQNTVASLLADNQGFLWIGTNNGLNRYDGYNFKIFKGNSEARGTFSNNRVVKIWQDEKDFIWFETHDGYYHYFHPAHEIIHSIPNYLARASDDNYIISGFEQYSENDIWISLTDYGAYHLRYNPENQSYTQTHFQNRGVHALTNNSLSFVNRDSTGNLWIGSDRGINFVSKEDLDKNSPGFQHFFVDYTFTSFCETPDFLWFGTQKNGIITYDKKAKIYSRISSESNRLLPGDKISRLYSTKTGKVLVGIQNHGLLAFDINSNQWSQVKTTGKNINQIYEDHYGQIWITSEEFGVDRLKPDTGSSRHFMLTSTREAGKTDKERHYFFEDDNHNLWIGLHGGALAVYQRDEDQFRFYRNDPSDPNSISSNIVHCITQDHAGQLWLGTGQFLGGLERAILRNPAFNHFLPEKDIKEITDNVTRAIWEDDQKRIWTATKAGRLHVMNDRYEEITKFEEYVTQKGTLSGVNIYSIITDDKGFLWLGSKGKGILVSEKPLQNYSNIRNIKFIQYTHSPENNNSLTHDNVYCIRQNSNGDIWIGTYGNGLSIVRKDTRGRRFFENINTQNSNLSSNMVRNILFDTQNRMWVATGFGLNLLRDSIPEYRFSNYYYEPGDNQSLSYNDVIHICEDNEKDLWFGTLGGGVNKLINLKDSTATFQQYTSLEGLSNDVVLAVLKGEENHVWVSTENGLNKINKIQETVEIFNTNNGLSLNVFMENTCLRRSDGQLLFGGYKGIEAISPKKVTGKTSTPRIELTNLQLFNKSVYPYQPNSPLEKTIPYTTSLTLKPHQSSFSIEYSALDFQNPKIIQYAYKLQNFDQEWNFVGNQTKATFTNLPPGQYIFKVKSTNRNGGWNKIPRELQITILPPWYKTIWAYTGYALIFIFFILGIRKIVVKINSYRNELTIEKRINELKLRFFTNISHEIRTPLTLILGPLEDIKRKTREVSPEIYRELQVVHKNGKRMLQLINQLLDFRKIQNNKMKLKVSKFDIVKFAREVYDSFAPMAHHNNLEISFHSDQESIEIWADAHQIDVVLYNILSNAVKFTPSGKKVALTIKHSADRNVTISIKDEGKGIPEKSLQDIFTRYTILSDQEMSGTGIGLSLAHEITRLHGGRLSVESTEGSGSTFNISLPPGKKHLEKREDVNFYEDELPHHHPVTEDTFEPQEINDSNENKDKKPGKASVLVVEDNPEILDYICHALNQDFNTTRALNGEEGLKIIETLHPDLIITDVMMPGINGMELTEQLKNNFSTSHVPIIMLTAKSDIEDQITGLQCGADAYLPKPFNTKLLQTVALNLIEQRKRIIAKFRDNKTIDPETLKVTSKDEEFLQTLVSFIQDNYSNEFSIEELAEQLCVSRTVFYNKVKGLTGMSPVEFVRQMKLKIAAQLLEKGYNVSEVSFKIGFNDVKYFSKQFKNLFGYPPSKHMGE